MTQSFSGQHAPSTFFHRGTHSFLRAGAAKIPNAMTQSSHLLRTTVGLVWHLLSLGACHRGHGWGQSDGPSANNPRTPFNGTPEKTEITPGLRGDVNPGSSIFSGVGGSIPPRDQPVPEPTPPTPFTYSRFEPGIQQDFGCRRSKSGAVGPGNERGSAPANRQGPRQIPSPQPTSMEAPHRHRTRFDWFRYCAAGWP